jgi:hypothetical protein
MNENKNSRTRTEKNDIPIDQLHDHLISLHSAPENRNLAEAHINILRNKEFLEQNRNKDNSLDNPITLDEIQKAV